MDAKRLDGIDERVKKYYLAELQEVYAPTSLAIAVAERLEKERDDLQSKLEKAEKGTKNAWKAFRNVDNENEEFRNQINDLQKQVAVMREALGLAIEFADIKILAQHKDVQKTIVTALDTPPTAYEQRVQMLVDVLDTIANQRIDAKYDSFNRQELVNCVIKAREVLAAFREKNEETDIL